MYMYRPPLNKVRLKLYNCEVCMFNAIAINFSRVWLNKLEVSFFVVLTSSDHELVRELDRYRHSAHKIEKDLNRSTNQDSIDSDVRVGPANEAFDNILKSIREGVVVCRCVP